MKNDDLWRFSSFPEHILFGGHFSKWDFAEVRSARSLWCLEKIQGPMWRSKDHLVMKGLSRNVENQEFSRNPLFGETENWRPRGLLRRRIPFRSVLSCQNALNRHMGQKTIVWLKHYFFSFSFFGPIGSLFRFYIKTPL